MPSTTARRGSAGPSREYPGLPETTPRLGLKGSTDPAVFKKAVEAAMVPEFVPKQGVKIATDPKEAEKAPAAPPPDEDEASDTS